MGKAVAISTYDVDKIFKICGTCVDKSNNGHGTMEKLQWIKIEIRGEKFTAIGCDGIRMATVSGETIATDTEKEFDLYVKPVKIDKTAQYVAFILNDDRSVEIFDGVNKAVFKPTVADFINYEYLFDSGKAKHPVEVCIDAKFLAEILNSIKGHNNMDRRVMLTIDVDNTERPMFIQPIEHENQKVMLCTIRKPRK